MKKEVSRFKSKIAISLKQSETIHKITSDTSLQKKNEGGLGNGF
jgi:hypothetical protein